ncbi:MAG TPA: hypothetical protein VL137_09690, partial [Polyangiaceae bacterium]|nr:hypothetical protein [Polyangiaceae bacterium]
MTPSLFGRAIRELPLFVALLMPACAASPNPSPRQSTVLAIHESPHAPEHVCPCKLHLPPEEPNPSAGKACAAAADLTQPNACLQFDDPQQALSEVTQLKPQILAIGE